MTKDLPLSAGRYWVFCGSAFKRGGFFDYAGSYPNISQCINILLELSREGKASWWHIFDSLRQQVILSQEAHACIEMESRLELEDFSGETK